MKNKLIKHEKLIFNIYLFLLLFNIINREFVPFFDLRYIILLLAVILSIRPVILLFKKKKQIGNSKIFGLILLLYFFIAISNFRLINIPYPIHQNELFNLTILYLFNFINMIALYLNSEYINADRVVKYFKLSILFLSISMILAFFFHYLPFSSYPGITEGPEHYNLFGLQFRLSGYMIDPNYITLLAFVFVALLYQYCRNNTTTIWYYLLSFFLVAFSFSKTIIMLLIPVIMAVVILKRLKNTKWYHIFSIATIVTIFCLPFVLYQFDIMGNMVTMDLRYKMWNRAIELFLENPLFGNGLSSFRSYMGIMENWYVQCHSTIFQILSEHGLVALAIFGMIIYQIINKKNNLLNFTILIYLAWSTCYETLYLNFLILFLALLPNLHLKKIIPKKRTSIFIINSFQNGGAERVVLTQAKQLLKEGHHVTFILFRNRVEYDLDKEFEIIKLTEQSSFTKLQKIVLLPILVLRLNHVMKILQQQYEIELLTSHLPLPHFICRLSNIKREVIYVLHNPHYQFSFSKKLWFRNLLKWMYQNNKIVAVSVGVKNELMEDYHIKTNKITNIYNPLDLDNINQKLSEPNTVDVKEDYIILCGRLTRQKCPERMIEAFYRGKFYEKYKLVLIGIGELEELIREQIREYQLEKSVLLKGWQKNSYQWIQKARLLVCSSDYESFGMVLAEALACNTPVVSVNCKFGPNEILVDELKCYLSTFEIDDLVCKMNDALKTYPENLTKYVQKFDVKNNIQSYLKVWKEWE